MDFCVPDSWMSWTRDFPKFEFPDFQTSNWPRGGRLGKQLVEGLPLQTWSAKKIRNKLQVWCFACPWQARTRDLDWQALAASIVINL